MMFSWIIHDQLKIKSAYPILELFFSCRVDLKNKNEVLMSLQAKPTCRPESIVIYSYTKGATPKHTYKSRNINH